jgi:hypothetical protein
MELDALIKVRQDAPLLESVSKTDSEIVKRCRSIRMAGRTSLQGFSTLFHIVCHVMTSQLSHARAGRNAGG